MISVIICSADAALLQDVKKNIEATIGTEYELIAVDNRTEKKGISAVYNIAAATARYNILCFLHEDVRIHSGNWGLCLINLLSRKEIGLVGVSGTVYKPAYPAAWSACDPSCYRVNTIQHFRSQSQPVASVLNPLQKKFEEVAVLDGVFLATRKDIFTTYAFDEQHFSGFHCYDLDYSLQVGSRYKTVVTYDILIEHFSEGNINGQWFADTITLHKKWAAILPKQTGIIGKELKKRSDYIACRSFLQQALRFSASKRMILQYYIKLVTRYWNYNHLAYSKKVFSKLLTGR